MNRVKHGVCRICGCTDTTPCYTHKEGACWWIDETHTLCSHCFYGFCEPQIEDILNFENTEAKEMSNNN